MGKKTPACMHECMHAYARHACIPARPPARPHPATHLPRLLELLEEDPGEAVGGDLLGEGGEPPGVEAAGPVLGQDRAHAGHEVGVVPGGRGRGGVD